MRAADLSQPRAVECPVAGWDNWHQCLLYPGGTDDPSLLGRRRKNLSPAEIARFPLIEAEWPPPDTEAPTWPRWQTAAKGTATARRLSTSAAMSFREELHAIEAVVAGQGLGICSDVLVEPELTRGALVRVSDIILPGYGFYIVRRTGHPKQPSIRAFAAWARSMV